jgi:hypothetical protein
VQATTSSDSAIQGSVELKSDFTHYPSLPLRRWGCLISRDLPVCTSVHPVDNKTALHARAAHLLHTSDSVVPYIKRTMLCACHTC